MKRSIFPLSGLLLLLSLLLASCASAAVQPAAVGTVGKAVKTAKGQYTDITVAELQSMLKNKDFFFVNVHIPFQGKIDPTDVFIPYNEIAQNLDKLPADKSAKIVLYCHSGNMSTTAGHTLADLGYTHVYNLAGGFTAWQQAGLPLDMNQ
jgi:rhodanese-related sulfurtransferase